MLKTIPIRSLLDKSSGKCHQEQRATCAAGNVWRKLLTAALDAQFRRLLRFKSMLKSNETSKYCGSSRRCPSSTSLLRVIIDRIKVGSFTACRIRASRVWSRPQRSVDHQRDISHGYLRRWTRTISNSNDKQVCLTSSRRNLICSTKCFFLPQ